MVKLVPSLIGIELPVYLDSTIVGMVLNVIVLVLVSAQTQVSPEEKAARRRLFVVPQSEKDPADIKKTQKYLKAMIVLGVVVALILFFVWGLPVTKYTA